MIACFTSCSLEEDNPSGFTVETVAVSSVEGYLTILNNCYFGWIQRYAGNQYYGLMSEPGTDLWTYQKNDNSWREFFKYGAGSSVNYNKFKDQWHAGYDGIGYCNLAMKLADMAPFNNEEEKNRYLAEAYFLRAIYYFYLVEQYGGVTLITSTEEVDLHPEKTDPMTIYEEVIIPDLIFATEWLPVDNGISRPGKKSALGFLAKAYLQTVEYDETKKYAGDALATAQLLINDCESGGAIYGAYMYDTFEEVFDEANNQDNRESLWSHRFVEGGNPRNAWETNETNRLYYCPVADFPARESRYLEWGGISGGRFMPSHYLLNLFVQGDGTLDPRYHQSFQTVWECNVLYAWTAENLLTYDRSDAVSVADTLFPEEGDTAVLLVHPNDADYESRISTKRDRKYLVVDLADVYNDTVRMYYTRQTDGVTSSNVFRSFYPSLMKFNSSDVYIARTDKQGYIGNNNATFIMRMAEVYLIAAEADIYANGGNNALGYINRVRSRAGAIPLNSTPDVQTVLDERARELCGEFHRWYDLKRTGKLTKAYLSEKNYDVGQFFVDNVYHVRPIPTEFLNTIEDGGAYYQNPGYN